MRALFLLIATAAIAAEPTPMPPGNRMLDDYFERQVVELEGEPLVVPRSADEWREMRLAWRAELAEMLGLSPWSAGTPLSAVKTGEFAGDGFVVEKLHFQSQPGLYVTANVYRPAKPAGRLPAILYMCGHSDVKGKDGTSLGNKAGYEHHGAWYARHGYVCIVLDTVDLGEIRGEHHGTYSKGRWWWISRGYTPAGVEAWAGIRALDYLATRDDVDMERIGVAGRSGGGAYSWWIAALDDRVKVAVPTAGITTLRNHVVDGAVEGHCDCMFMVNTRRWDYDKVAALVAPRPLLIANTDKDDIFPLDGVMAIHASVRRIYRALGADGKLGLQIAEGPHKDTQALNTGEFAWFERWLKGADPMATFDEAAKKSVDPENLRVFSSLPGHELNTRIDEIFVMDAVLPPPVPENPQHWAAMRDGWMRALQREVFAGWPKTPCDLALRAAGTEERDGVTIRAWDFTPQEPWTLRLHVAQRAGEIAGIILAVPDEENGPMPDADTLRRIRETGVAFAWFAPRGVGPTAWSGTEKEQTQRLRRFYLLGQTLDGMRVWDIRRAVAALRAAGFDKPPLTIEAGRAMAGNALYASLFVDGVSALMLHEPPSTHARGPIFLNVLKHLDMPQAVAIAAARCKVSLFTQDKVPWAFAADTAAALGRREWLMFFDEAAR